jgi:hypothetical protein
MPIEFAYQVIKDLVALAKMEEVDPIDPGTLDPKELAAMGIIDNENAEAYSWSAPRKLFARTEAPDASHEIAWVTDKLRRTKRKVVRFTHDGNLDLILIRKKRG